MRTNYILVDYENVQPKEIDLLQGGSFVVKVFLGPNQTRIPVSLACSLQALGSNAEYILLETSGSNALDFHIAYYIGVLSAANPDGYFHIISKDTGFDPLVKHLRGKGIYVMRSQSIGEIPSFRISASLAAAEADALVEVAMADLIRRKLSRPRTQKTLINALNALFRKELSEERVTEVFESLRSRGIVKLKGDSISYDLPEDEAA